jgi:predicted TIM-barrel fold metal-dependent hydrolase
VLRQRPTAARRDHRPERLLRGWSGCKVRGARVQAGEDLPNPAGWELANSAFIDALEDLAWNNLPAMVEASECGIPSKLVTALADRKVKFILEGIMFENMSEAVSVLRRADNIMVETSQLRVPGALRFLVDQVGVERVLFGSGCIRSSLAAALAYVNESELSDEQKEAVLGGNAARLFGG